MTLTDFTCPNHVGPSKSARPPMLAGNLVEPIRAAADLSIAFQPLRDIFHVLSVSCPNPESQTGPMRPARIALTVRNCAWWDLRRRLCPSDIVLGYPNPPAVPDLER